MLAVALSVVALDETTKSLARALLPISSQIDGRGLRLAGAVGFERVRNAGSAAGFGQGRFVWTAFALGGLAVALTIAIAASRNRHAAFAAGLLAGGAIGNVAERLVSGAVTDFIAIGDATHGACLNVADVALVVGAALLVRERVSARHPHYNVGEEVTR